jgi:hypothetical protein
MRVLVRWAWVIVLGTALSLSWWSLDVLARRYGVPSPLAAVVSATFDGAALVAAELAMQRAQVADSAAAVKLFMMAAVGLSAGLNYEHGLLLGYPIAIRVLFAAPSVISGLLFELQLRNLHRARLHELDRVAPALPRFGFLVWLFHPIGVLQRVSQIAASRLQSVPVTVMDWESEQTTLVALPLSAPVAELEPATDDGANGQADTADPEQEAEKQEAEPDPPTRPGRKPIPDEVYASQLRQYLVATGEAVPSARQVADLLSIGQDRARRLVKLVGVEREA